MTSKLQPTDDRETLCALFDDELQGDEARFALKRLGHDAQWRQACGRWQLYGDVLRGQATAVATGGFAERVAVAIAQESAFQDVTVTNVAKSAGSRRGWIGGALAASVAVAALFVTRPFSSETAPSTPDAPVQVASAPAASSAATSTPARVEQAPEAPAPQAPDKSLGLSAAAVAAVEVPRRAADRRASRGQSQRAALRASRQNQMPVAAVASAAPATAVASLEAREAGGTTATASAANPFQPQHAEPASRPWPRAVLPQYASGGAMTTSFGSGAESPSFYPFEPQPVQPSDENAASTREPPSR